MVMTAEISVVVATAIVAVVVATVIAVVEREEIVETKQFDGQWSMVNGSHMPGNHLIMITKLNIFK